MCRLTTRERQTAASTASMPNARLWRRGQAPKPQSGAPKAQGLTAAIAVAEPSNVPSFALKSTGVDRPIGTSAYTKNLHHLDGRDARSPVERFGQTGPRRHIFIHNGAPQALLDSYA